MFCATGHGAVVSAHRGEKQAKCHIVLKVFNLESSSRFALHHEIPVQISSSSQESVTILDFRSVVEFHTGFSAVYLLVLKTRRLDEARYALLFKLTQDYGGPLLSNEYQIKVLV